MSLKFRLWFGPAAASLFVLGIVLLPLMVPGYDPVRQTVSEVGEMGSPARVPFALLLCLVAACVVVLATALRAVSLRLDRPTWAAWLTACMAISAAGVGVFAYPHPLHNWFGLSELVGYQAPLVLALTWRGEASVRSAVVFSWVMSAVVWAAILANLASLDRHSAVWLMERPVYGLIQRGLFASFFVWLAGVPLLIRGKVA
jgi:hypothetical membrane protein